MGSYSKEVTYNGEVLPIFSLYYRPPNFAEGVVIQVDKEDSIPENASGSTAGLWTYRLDNNTARVYLIYNPYTDTIITQSTYTSNASARQKFLSSFLNSWGYKSYEFYRNPPASVLSSEGLGGRILVKLQAYILAGLSLGLSLYVLWIGYRAIDNFLYGVHKTYMQKKSARYIKSVMDESGGDPLGGGKESSRSSIDPSIEFPPPR